MTRTIARMFLPVLMILSAGCITKRVDYNPSYVPSSSPPVTAVRGKGLLLMEPSVYGFQYSGRPNSLQSGGVTMEMPLGKIVCETAVGVMNGLFTEGCASASQIDKSGQYAAVIQVRPLNYEYAYNQIRNLTMAITPQVRLSLQVVMMDACRNSFFSQVYDSGTVNDTTTLDTLRPAETINKHTHEIVHDLLCKAAVDMQTTLAARGTGAPARMGPSAEDSEPAPASSAGETPRERLQKLKKLYDDGLISKETYEQKQKEILKSY